MKFNLLIIIGLVTSLVATANRHAFKQIAENAQVANGSASVGSYNKKLTKEAIVSLGFKELKSEYRENCGPWEKIHDRRPNIKKIAELEEYDPNASTAAKLQELYKQDEIVAIVGAQSNGEESCSLSYFNVYGTDGSVLKLRYDLGD